MFDISSTIRLRIKEILSENFDKERKVLILEVDAFLMQIGFLGETEWHSHETQKYYLAFRSSESYSQYQGGANPELANRLKELCEKYFSGKKEQNDK